MAEITFYEKPGCLTNAKQKQLLVALGHRLLVKDLLAEPWEASRLRAFFGEQPVTAWFNPSAPSIRDGALDPTGLEEPNALALMVADPLLIRRPLLETDEGRCAGFERNGLLERLGVCFAPEQDLQGCSRRAAEPSCDERTDADGARSGPRTVKGRA